jgi:hypothetical protein
MPGLGSTCFECNTPVNIPSNRTFPQASHDEIIAKLICVCPNGETIKVRNDLEFTFDMWRSRLINTVSTKKKNDPNYKEVGEETFVKYVCFAGNMDKARMEGLSSDGSAGIEDNDNDNAKDSDDVEDKLSTDNAKLLKDNDKSPKDNDNGHVKDSDDPENAKITKDNGGEGDGKDSEPEKEASDEHLQVVASDDAGGVDKSETETTSGLGGGFDSGMELADAGKSIGVAKASSPMVNPLQFEIPRLSSIPYECFSQR